MYVFSIAALTNYQVNFKKKSGTVGRYGSRHSVCLFVKSVLFISIFLLSVVEKSGYGQLWVGQTLKIKL